jgi:hypothetical protein
VALRLVAPLGAAIVAIAAYRWHVGAPADAHGPLVQGLDGLLVSTGKSLFAYAPLLLLAPPSLVWLWRTHRAEAQLVLAVSAAVLLAAAGLDDWHGDPTWGPRRVVPLVPLLSEAVALAWSARSSGRPERQRASAALVLLTAVGILVQTVGIGLAPATYLGVVTDVRVATGAPSWFAETADECHFIPQFSPIIGHAWLLSHRVRNDRHFEIHPPYLLLLSSPPKLEHIWPRLTIDWFATRWPVPAAVAWLAALALAAMAAAWTLRRRLMLP